MEPAFGRVILLSDMIRIGNQTKRISCQLTIPRARCSFTTRVPPCCERCSRSTRGEIVNEQYTQQFVLPFVPSQTGNGQMGQLSQKGGGMGRDKRSAPTNPREWLLIDVRKRTTPFEGLHY